VIGLEFACDVICRMLWEVVASPAGNYAGTIGTDQRAVAEQGAPMKSTS